jgi:hypothetical protein
MNVNDRVLIKQDYKGYLSDIFDRIKINKVYGIIYNKVRNKVYIRFLHNYTDERNVIILFEKDCDVIPPEEYIKYEKLEKKFIIKYFSFWLDLVKSLKTKTKGTYRDKDFTIDKSDIDSHYVEVDSVGIFNKHKSCGDFLKRLESYDFYIPEYYLNFYGYTQNDLKKWLIFLSNCDLNFKGQYICKTTLEGKVNKTQSYRFSNNKNTRGQVSSGTDSIVHKIHVPASEYSWYQYLQLILLRYIHHHSYWFIPMLSMQIKDTLGDKVTYFQALMMAHLYKYDYSYNGLLDCTKHVNIFQNPENVLHNIREYRIMNTAFGYLENNKYDTTICEKLIEERKFEELLDYLKDFKS